MEKQVKSEEGRISAYVSPEAKAMLNELARRWFPNLRRPVGTALEQIIREAYIRETKEKQYGR